MPVHGAEAAPTRRDPAVPPRRLLRMFEDDAHVAARVLDITLTSREMGRGERLPMAGIPVHAADAYVARLIGAGLHVAIAEQIGVVPRNGIVPREIARVLTPGMLLESNLLTSSRSNFLLSVARERDGVGLAYVDVSTDWRSCTSPASFAGRAERASKRLGRRADPHWPRRNPARVRRSLREHRPAGFDPHPSRRRACSHRWSALRGASRAASAARPNRRA